jgi:LuxR family transcriptional regulator, quorum-sensing system regulator BjaR1
MLRVHSEALDFIDRIEQQRDIVNLENDFAGLVERNGFHTFIMTRLPSAGSDVEPLVISNKWPEPWTERYREQSYFADDPVSSWSLTRRRAFRWQDAQKASQSSRAAQINAESRDIGLVDGLGFPIRNSVHCQAVISLGTSERVDMSLAEIALLEIAASYFFLRGQELAERPHQPKGKLTKREREVLHWCAAGKSTWEIGQILSIAEGTAKLHRSAAIRKLDAMNTTHAVTIAISLGELQP